jgi:hypothetical protein
MALVLKKCNAQQVGLLTCSLVMLQYAVNEDANVRFQVFAAVTLKITVFWVVMLCNLVEVYQHSAGWLYGIFFDPEAGYSTVL